MTRSSLWKLSATLSLFAIAIVGLIIGAWIGRVHPPDIAPSIKVVFLNVSEGDCTVIQTPDGRTILIDAGSAYSGPEVVRSLRAMGIRRIDLLILASPLDSEVEGALSLLQNRMPIKSVWNNAVVNNEAGRKRVIAEITARHIPYRVVYGFENTQIGDSKMLLTVVWPPARSPRFQEDALTCRLDFGNTSFLFAGALSGSSESYMIAGAADKLHCDILQVAEHGNDTGTSLEMLRRAEPTTAVISCTPSTTPGQGTLHRLQVAGAGIWRTDTQGEVTIIADGRTSPIVAGSQL